MVKFYLDELSGKLGIVIDETYKKMEAGEIKGEAEFLNEGFGDSITDRLDDLFNL
jgi:hypothetical protein